MIFQVRHFYLIKLPQIHNLPLRSFLPTHPPGEREKEYQDFTKWKLRVIPLFSKVKDSSFWVLFFNIFYKSIFLLGYRRVDSLEKTLMLGGIGGRRKRGRQRMKWLGWLYGLEFEWTPGDGDRQGGLACCDSWGHKKSNMTERLNWTELNAESEAPVFRPPNLKW